MTAANERANVKNETPESCLSYSHLPVLPVGTLGVPRRTQQLQYRSEILIPKNAGELAESPGLHKKENMWGEKSQKCPGLLLTCRNLTYGSTLTSVPSKGHRFNAAFAGGHPRRAKMLRFALPEVVASSAQSIKVSIIA